MPANTPCSNSSVSACAPNWEREATRFQGTLGRGLREYRKVAERLSAQGETRLSGGAGFNLLEAVC